MERLLISQNCYLKQGVETGVDPARLSQQPKESRVSDRRGLAFEDLSWRPLASDVLEEAACLSAHGHWVYIVSAPDYAIVSGSQPT
jgi:hypothetical protein